MSLEGETWRPASIPAVVLAFLRAEQGKTVFTRIRDDPMFRALIETPDLENADENRLRMRILYSYRGSLLDMIPHDTSWFEVRYLRDIHLVDLRVIARVEWDSAQDHNELQKVAIRLPRQLQTPPDLWEPPVLWGHDRTGPFTILEGNNRLVAYVASGGTGLAVPAYVGLSPSTCWWHGDDPRVANITDHWRSLT